MTIDAYVDENNEDLEGHNDDSCWNFHVWNEIFITGKGHWPANYAGWAAIDATPQVGTFLLGSSNLRTKLHLKPLTS